MNMVIYLHAMGIYNFIQKPFKFRERLATVKESNVTDFFSTKYKAYLL